MAILIFAIMGILVVIVAELTGLLHVRAFDISKRSINIQSWRISLIYGILYVPVVGIVWSTILFWIGGSRFIADLSSWTGLTFIIGASIFLLAGFWMRLIIFAILPRHWQETSKIIEQRSKSDGRERKDKP